MCFTYSVLLCIHSSNKNALERVAYCPLVDRLPGVAAQGVSSKGGGAVCPGRSLARGEGLSAGGVYETPPDQRQTPPVDRQTPVKT